MSRRREPNGLVLVKIGCTGRRSHKKLVFDTVSVSADGDRIAVIHDALDRGKSNEANVPNQDDLGMVERWLTAPPVEFMNRVYKCPICLAPSGQPLTLPMRSDKDGEIFGKLAAAGVSFLDISQFTAILS